jgi:hypothetical protein
VILDDRYGKFATCLSHENLEINGTFNGDVTNYEIVSLIQIIQDHTNWNEGLGCGAVQMCPHTDISGAGYRFYLVARYTC